VIRDRYRLVFVAFDEGDIYLSKPSFRGFTVCIFLEVLTVKLLAHLDERKAFHFTVRLVSDAFDCRKQSPVVVWSSCLESYQYR
jgi:hypothetical protein